MRLKEERRKKVVIEGFRRRIVGCEKPTKNIETSIETEAALLFRSDKLLSLSNCSIMHVPDWVNDDFRNRPNTWHGCEVLIDDKRNKIIGK